MVEGMRKGEAAQGVRGQQGESRQLSLYASSLYTGMSQILSILAGARSVLASLG